MELTLHTEFTFDSAHRLEGYDGKCANLHGHSWKVEIWFRGDSDEKDKVGILIDFGYSKQLKELLDHKDITKVITIGNPTAENLTEWIYHYLRGNICGVKGKNIKIKVRVYESVIDKKCYCEGGDW